MICPDAFWVCFATEIGVTPVLRGYARWRIGFFVSNILPAEKKERPPSKGGAKTIPPRKVDGSFEVSCLHKVSDLTSVMETGKLK